MQTDTNTRVESAPTLYFRCHRLAATITPAQCRINRARCDDVLPRIDAAAPPLEEVRAPCFLCPQAAQVDDGRVRLFTLAQVVAGHALRQPAAEALVDEARFTAQPDVHEFFTSHYWVPECDL